MTAKENKISQELKEFARALGKLSFLDMMRVGLAVADDIDDELARTDEDVPMPIHVVICQSLAESADSILTEVSKTSITREKEA